MEMWDTWCTGIHLKRINIFLKYRPKNLTVERDIAFQKAFYKSENYEDFCNRLSEIYKDGENAHQKKILILLENMKMIIKGCELK